MSSAPRKRTKRLAEKILQIRETLNLSQLELIEHLGLGDDYYPSFVSYWERSIREPPLEVILRYARAFGISTDVLIDDELNLPNRKRAPSSKPVAQKPQPRKSAAKKTASKK